MIELLVEKYKPKTRADIIGNKDVIDKLFSMVATKQFTHLCLEGLSGSGKSSSVEAMFISLFGTNYKQNVLELNASDSRRVDDVRGTMKTFAKTTALGSGLKFVWLDEGDELTDEAQNALRRIMEKYSSFCIFVFTANNAYKLIPAIRSRCQTLHFGPVPIEEIAQKLEYILNKELVSTSESLPVMRKIAEMSQGDVRNAINTLQTLIVSGKPITLDSVDISLTLNYGKLIVDALQKGRFMEARINLHKALGLGYNPRQIINLCHNVYILDETIDFDMKKNAIFELAECDYRLTLGVETILAFDKILMRLTKQ